MFYDSFLSPSNGTFCLHENTDLLRKQTNKQHLFQTFLWKETLKVVAAAAPCAPWPRSHLPQHDLPQHPPSLSGCHVPPPPTSHSPAKCCWQHQHREAQHSETELSFHTLLSENAIKVQALLTLSNSSLTETMLLQRL